ncbi:hypothetical protein IEO21_10609 [Rhodonia placenta]|uniref:Retrotransposon gag domain-containing protein n=1 Tax=Rhodonia placenta TaxID=104341 RepID=A0A8H7NS59_9APHY|nr:hypothetical protein IEO21_10609 [Postia placenta]
MAQQGLDQGFDGSWGDTGIPQPPQPAPPEAGVNPTDTADRILFQAVAALGRHQDAFANNQQLQSAALESLARSIDELRQRVSATPAPSTSAGPRNIKVRDPRMFNGKSSEVVPFLREDGSPIQWFNTIEAKRSELLYDWEELQRIFTTRFQDSDLVSTSLRKLEALKQTGSAATYANLFEEYLTYVDVSDYMQITYFDRNLKPRLKEILVNEKRPATLDEWIPTVITADNRLHELERETPSSSTVVPMEIDADCPNMSDKAKKARAKAVPSGKA